MVGRAHSCDDFFKPHELGWQVAISVYESGEYVDRIWVICQPKVASGG
jgi:hypothetical protein